ncbi:hypothetical protein G159_03570 [Planococcus glaciei CHR43]|nr:hypothetical protein G159_03570 [Planococcus glaciei CHR43]
MPSQASLKRLEGLVAGARQQEKRKRPCRFDGHKTDRRSGIFPAVQPGWLMTPRIWPLQLDNKKSIDDRLALTSKIGTKRSLVPIFATKHKVLQEQGLDKLALCSSFFSRQV